MKGRPHPEPNTGINGYKVDQSPTSLDPLITFQIYIHTYIETPPSPHYSRLEEKL
jgi:hypothetical protein